MPTSHYFPLNHGGYQGEQNLIQDLVDEQIFLFGADCKYIPRKKIIDKIMNDLILSRFEEIEKKMISDYEIPPMDAIG